MDEDKSIDKSEIVKFIFFGGLSTLVHLGLLALFVEVLNFSYISVSNAVASILSIIFSYFMNKVFVFQKSDDKLDNPIIKFAVTYTIVFAIHFVVPLILSDFLRLPYQLSFVIALLIHVPLAFLLNKFWVFNET